MKKIFLTLALIFTLSVGQASAQDWKNLLGKVAQEVAGDVVGSDESGVLGNVLGAVLGNSLGLSETSLEGQWKYNGIACVLESEDALSSIGGTYITSTIEGKLDEAVAKFGVVPGSCEFVFNSDNTCSFTVAGQNITGTYNILPEEKRVTFSFLFGQINIKAYLACTLTDVNVVFEADKLLNLLKSVSSKASSNSSQSSSAMSTGLNLASTVLGAYDGMMLGVKLNRIGNAPASAFQQQATETETKTETKTSNKSTGKSVLKSIFGF